MMQRVVAVYISCERFSTGDYSQLSYNKYIPHNKINYYFNYDYQPIAGTYEFEIDSNKIVMNDSPLPLTP